MAKTLGADSHNYEHILEVLKPYLERGCSIHEACLQSKQPYDAILAKTKRSEEYLQKIQAMQDVPVVMARQVWLAKIQDGDYMASRDYLRAKRKEEFSERVETHNSGGLDLSIDPDLDKQALDAIIRNT